MRTEITGSDLGFLIPLARMGEPFVPDSGTVNWSLRGQDGSQLVAPTTITGIVDTQVALTVVAAHNNVDPALAFEKRTILVTGTIGGVQFTIREPYRVCAWFNYTAVPADVRAFIGTDTGELPDDDIDLMQAYLDVRDVVTKVVLDTALESGDSTEIAANRAIVARAVVNVTPSLQARLVKSQSDGSTDIDRFRVDFDQLLVDARDALARNINAMLPAVQVTNMTFALTSTNVDPITGN